MLKADIFSAYEVPLIAFTGLFSSCSSKGSLFSLEGQGIPSICV